MIIYSLILLTVHNFTGIYRALLQNIFLNTLVKTTINPLNLDISRSSLRLCIPNINFKNLSYSDFFFGGGDDSSAELLSLFDTVTNNVM